MVMQKLRKFLKSILILWIVIWEFDYDCLLKPMNRAFHPGGHYWDYYPGTLCWSQVADFNSSHCNSFEDLPPIDEIYHEDVIKWKHCPRYWPFVRGIHRSPVNSPHTGQWRGALMISLICARINGWVNNREAGDLRRHRAHYDVIVMWVSNL